MISKQLKIEGLADISKSTVENRWNQAQAERYLPTKKSTNFGKTEAKLLEQVNQIRIDKQRSERVRDLQLQRAETPEGREGIFKNSKELRKFVEHNLYDSQVLKEFKLYCEADNLSLAKTLCNVIETLDKYEDENEDLFWPDLSSYIEEKLGDYLEGEEQRKSQKQLQKKFSDFLLNFRCDNCDAPYDTMWILGFEGTIECKCGSSYKPLCVSCKSELYFDRSKDTWSCRKCDATFEKPRLRLSDFTFIREPL